MNPTTVALWSLGVLAVLKLIAYFVYKHLSKKSAEKNKDALEPHKTNNEK
ncbi:hypothetical protein O1D97_06470 [Marinomonas sp. 15G1-11]|uniref:Uncharacterized protein n=1 Tax=Marinomonas phaeophyticola TaxID=3004091 RepID=A0ABT4JSE1_9GAMM|nr:hypothetical protein [Marinomonas sp. 15G1-11]MCZ2721298.1 hypothetical protein [Marinomonas sp. 15G1-11]